MIKTVEWTKEGVRLLDQRLLPNEEKYVTLYSHEEVAEAIKNMTVRGAPAIGVAAAMGLALGASQSVGTSVADLEFDFEYMRQVIADETRQFLQGSRLTAWELSKDNIPVTVITDNMAGHVMKQGKVDCVIVGADRIAANGDAANKIGTYMVAVLAKQHNIPFYVAAPISTVDLSTPTGEDIPIEERDAKEVTHVRDNQLAPDGIGAHNFAFDVTPNELIAAIITDRGVARAPYTESLRTLVTTRSAHGS